MIGGYLERLKGDHPKTPALPTAKTAKSPTLAENRQAYELPKPPKAPFDSFDSTEGGRFPEIEGAKQQPTEAELSRVRAWLAFIGETDADIIGDVLGKCRADPDALAYYLGRAEETPVPQADDDDRQRCSQCANLAHGGRCMAAWREEIESAQHYRPVLDLPRRCEGYAPRPVDTDQRPGRER